MQHRRFKKVTLAVLLTLILSMIFSLSALCDTTKRHINSESGYAFFVEDNAGLFDRRETDTLIEYLGYVSEFGNAGVITLSENNYSGTEDFASKYLYNEFGPGVNSVILVIDMDYRLITVWAEGNGMKKVRSYGTTITDNIYTYASDGDYGMCALEGVSEIYSVLNGEKIARPMKFISNALLSLVLALLISYIIARKASSASMAGDREVLNAIFSKFELKNPRAKFSHRTRVYDPPSSSSSGGGSSGGGGGGGCGGGGSHGF